ncbi:MAG: phage terminase large subunit [Alphaproteobacteria bacterium]
MPMKLIRKSKLYKPTHQRLHATIYSVLAALIQKLFHVLGTGTEFQKNWHIEAIAWHLQQVEKGKFTRLIINVGPRYLKSFSVSVVYPIWVLGRDPSKKIICISYSEDLALLFSRMRRSAMESSFVQLAFPKLKLDRRKLTEKEIVTTKGGGIYVTSVGGTLTGRGADILIIDDPMKAEGAYSDAERNKVHEWFTGTALSRLNDKKNGVIIIVAQRVHDDDLCGRLLEHSADEWTHLDLPAIAEKDEEIEIGDGKTYSRKIGEALHPERESIETLEKIKWEIGSANFAAQYQQRPIPPTGQTFKAEWFQRFDLTEDISSFTLIIQSWDTAAGIGENNAYSACTTWSIVEGRLVLLDVVRKQLDFPTLIKFVESHASKFSADLVLVEEASSGIQVVQQMQQSSDHHVVGIKPIGEKLGRAMNASVLVEQGLVYVPNEAPWLNDFLAEVLKFPQVKFKDQVDSMSQFLNWWLERGNRKLAVRVRTLNGGTTKISYQDSYYRRTGIPTLPDDY